VKNKRDKVKDNADTAKETKDGYTALIEANSLLALKFEEQQKEFYELRKEFRELNEKFELAIELLQKNHIEHPFKRKKNETKNN
jgi:predicted nuclease with TOPRIM domain